jgi:hypothetical protein
MNPQLRSDARSSSPSFTNTDLCSADHRRLADDNNDDALRSKQDSSMSLPSFSFAVTSIESNSSRLIPSSHRDVQRTNSTIILEVRSHSREMHQSFSGEKFRASRHGNLTFSNRTSILSRSGASRSNDRRLSNQSQCSLISSNCSCNVSRDRRQSESSSSSSSNFCVKSRCVEKRNSNENVVETHIDIL